MQIILSISENICNSKLRSLRGGGACTSRNQSNLDLIAGAQLTQYCQDKIINEMISKFQQFTSDIQNIQSEVNSDQGKEVLMKFVKWFIDSEQLFSHFLNQPEDFKSCKKLIQDNFTSCLVIVPDLIQSEKLLSLQLLKICNCLARIIFFYFTHQNTKESCNKVEEWNPLIKEIKYLVEAEGEQSLFYNGLCYELSLIELCVGALQSREDDENEKKVLKDTLIGLFTSAKDLSLSEDLTSALKDGAQLLYSKFQKHQSKEKFKFCLYFEQLKWNIIRQIEEQKDQEKIKQSIQNIYNGTISKINDWNILYSWIKIISELMVYKPQISKIQFKNYKQNDKEEIDWDKAIQLRYIKQSTSNSHLAEILHIENPQNLLETYLNQIFINFRLLQNFLITGNKDLPQFVSYYQLKQDNKDLKEEISQQQLQSQVILEQLKHIPFQEMTNYLENTINLFQNYLENFRILQNDCVDSENLQIQQRNNSLKLLFIQNNQLIEQSIGLKVFPQFLSSLFNNEKIQVEQGENQLKLHNFVCFFQFYKQIGISQTTNQQNDLENQLMEMRKVHDFLFIEETSELQKINKKLDEYIKIYDVEKKNQKFSFQQQIKRALLFFNIFQSIFTHNQLTENLFLDREIIASANKTQQPQQIYYHMIISVLQTLQNIIFELKDILQDNFVFKNLETLKEAFNLSINTYVELFCQYFQDNIQHRVNQAIKNQVLLKQFENQLILPAPAEWEQEKHNFEKLLSKTSNLFDEIEKALEFISIFQKNLYKLKEMVFKKGKNKKSLEVNYQKLDNQMNQFLATFPRKNENYLNLKDKIIELQNQAQIIQIQLIQIGDIAQQPQKEFNELIRLLNYTLSQQNENINSIEESLIQNLQSFEELIESQWAKFKQDQPKLFNQNAQDQSQNIQNNNQITKQEQEEIENNFKENFNEINQLQSEIKAIQISQLQSKIQYLFCFKLKESIFDQIKELMKEILKSTDVILNKIQNKSYQKSYLDNENQKKVFFQIVSLKTNPIFLQELIMILNQNLPFFNIQQAYKNYQSKKKQQTTGWVEKISDFIKNNFWRVKEGFIFQCIQIQSSLSEQNREIISKNLILISAKETDQRILKTIKNKEIIQQMIQSFNKYWDDMESIIEQDLKTLLKNLEQVQNDLKICENENKKKQLLEEHERLEQQIEQQLVNVSSIGDALGITINFLKDIKKDLAVIQQKLDQIQKQLNEVGLDIKYLRGKTPFQLFEIRMQKILQQKQKNERESVYVQLRTRELIQNSKNEEEEETTLFSDEQQNYGEVNEFLSQQKDSLLIHGPAGSGKSVAAQKIEEFIWLQYQENQNRSNNQKQSQRKIPLIPIFIQLSSLKNPLLEAVEETLLSSSYNFDQKQIVEFKEQVAQGQAKLIFILDSYDELSKSFSQQNIIISNKFKSWKFDSSNIENLNQQNLEISTIGFFPKIITTTRSEQLQSNNYKEWFLSESNFDYSKYKEVRILIFDKKQQQEYLQQFSYLQIKLLIFEFLDNLNLSIIKGAGYNQYLDQIWFEIFDIILAKENQTEKMLNEEQIKIIIQMLKKNQRLDIRKELEEYLSKQLQQIWSINTFQKYITEFNLQQLLITPFMMKIVVDVLPQLNQELNSHSTKRISFIKNYCEKMYFSFVKPCKSSKELIQLKKKIQDYSKGKTDEVLEQTYFEKQRERMYQSTQKSSIIKSPRLRVNQQIKRPQQIEQQIPQEFNQPQIINKQIVNQNEIQNIDQLIILQQQDSKMQVPQQDLKKQFEIEFDEANTNIRKSQQDLKEFQSKEQEKDDVIQEIFQMAQNRWQIYLTQNFKMKDNLFSFDQKEPIIVDQSYKQFYLTPFDFYQTFYINYVKKNQKKLVGLNHKSLVDYQSQIFRYSEVFTVELMKKQLIGVDYEQKGLVNIKGNKVEQVNEFYELFDEAAPNAGIFQQFRKCIPLKQKGNFISFEHKSIQEYLFAKCIYESLNNIEALYKSLKALKVQIVQLTEEFSTKQLIIQYLKKFFAIIRWNQGNSLQEFSTIIKEKMQLKEQNQHFPKFLSEINELMIKLNQSPLNQFTLSSEFYLGTLKILSDKIKSNLNLRKILRFLIELSKYFPEYINISSNSFQLLVYMQEFFMGNDFKKLRLKDIQLIGMKCFGCDFMNSHFKDVKMIGVDLNYCNLTQAIWENIITDDTPYYQFKFPVINASHSVNGEFLAVQTSMNEILWFHSQSGAFLYNYKIENHKCLRDFCWSSINQDIAICLDYEVEIFQIGMNLKHFDTHKFNEQVYSVKFFKKSTLLAVGCENQIEIINPYSNNHPIKLIPVRQDICNQYLNQRDQYISQAQKLIVSQYPQYQTQQSSPHLYSQYAQQEILPQDQDIIEVYRCLDLPMDDRQLVACTKTKMVLFQKESDNWTLIKSDVFQKPITNLSFSPDGCQVAIACIDCNIYIFDTKELKILRQIECSKPVWGLQYSPDSTFLACGGEDQTITLYNPTTLASIKSFKGHSDSIFSISFSKPFGNTILSTSKDLSVKEWNLQLNSQFNEYLHGHEETILFVIITNDQQRIISKGKDKKILQWDFFTGEILNPIIILSGCIKCSNSILCKDCSRSPILSIQNDQYIATGGNGDQILIFDAFNGKIYKQYENNILSGQIFQMIYYTNSDQNDRKDRRELIFYQTFANKLYSLNLESQEILCCKENVEIMYMEIYPRGGQSEQHIIFTIDFKGKITIFDLDMEIKCHQQLSLQKDFEPFKEQTSQLDYYQGNFVEHENYNIKIKGVDYQPYQTINHTQNENSLISVFIYQEIQALFLALKNNAIIKYSFQDYSYNDYNVQFQQVKRFQHPCQISTMNSHVDSENNHFLVTCGLDLTLRIYDEQLQFRGQYKLCHQDDVLGFIGLKQQNFGITWSLDKSIKIWQILKNIKTDPYLKDLKYQIEESRNQLQIFDQFQQSFDPIFQLFGSFERISQSIQRIFPDVQRCRQDFNTNLQNLATAISQIQNFHQHLQDLKRMIVCEQKDDIEENQGVERVSMFYTRSTETQRQNDRQQNQQQRDQQTIQEIKEKQIQLNNITKTINSQVVNQTRSRLDILSDLMRGCRTDFQMFIQQIEGNLKATEEQYVVQMRNLEMAQQEQERITAMNQNNQQFSQQQIPEDSYNLKFQEYLYLSKFPQITKFIGSNFSESKITSVIFPDLTNIWKYKQKKYEILID